MVDLKLMPEAFRPHLEGIRQETDALGEVVTNFLNFAKPAQVSFFPVNLRAIAEPLGNVRLLAMVQSFIDPEMTMQIFFLRVGYRFRDL